MLGEELNKTDGSVLSPMRTGSLYKDSWALASGRHAHAQHHEYIVGRFGELTFTCESATATASLEPSVSMWVVRAHDAADEAARMETSSAPLDDVWHFARYTSVATSLDLYSDSNARQRSVDCMADDNTAMRLSYGTSSQLALQRYAMLQALTVCGSLAAPGGGGGAQSCMAEWTVLPLIMARDDALHTGDLSFVRQHYDGLVASALGHTIDPTTQLVRNDSVLIDWPPSARDGYVLSRYNSVANAFAYRGLRTLVEIAGWLGRTEDAARHARIAAALKAAINEHMWNGTAFCDGICSNISHTAFHSTMYMLAFGAVDDANRLAAWQYLRGRIDPPFGPSGEQWPPEPPGNHGMPCSSYTAQFALQALYVGKPLDHGHSALQVLTSDAKHSWRHMISQGATATMEAWDTDEKPNLTWSHVWSASPGFLIPWFLFGLLCVTPGCTELQVRPAVGDLEHGAYSLPTVKGPVRCSFKQPVGGDLSVQLALPVGIEASVGLPHPGPEDVHTTPTAQSCPLLVNGAPWCDVRQEEAHLVAFGLRGGVFTVQRARSSR